MPTAQFGGDPGEEVRSADGLAVELTDGAGGQTGVLRLAEGHGLHVHADRPLDQRAVDGVVAAGADDDLDRPGPLRLGGVALLSGLAVLLASGVRLTTGRGPAVLRLRAAVTRSGTLGLPVRGLRPLSALGGEAGSNRERVLTVSSAPDEDSPSGDPGLPLAEPWADGPDSFVPPSGLASRDAGRSRAEEPAPVAAPPGFAPPCPVRS